MPNCRNVCMPKTEPFYESQTMNTVFVNSQKRKVTSHVNDKLNLLVNETHTMI